MGEKIIPFRRRQEEPAESHDDYSDREYQAIVRRLLGIETREDAFIIANMQTKSIDVVKELKRNETLYRAWLDYNKRGMPDE